MVQQCSGIECPRAMVSGRDEQLGWLYEHGKGVKKDRHQAILGTEKANRGSQDAQASLKRLGIKN